MRDDIKRLADELRRRIGAPLAADPRGGNLGYIGLSVDDAILIERELRALARTDHVKDELVVPDDWRERERLSLLWLRELLDGCEVEEGTEPLLPPSTYLETIVLTCRFQPGCSGKAATANRIREILSAPIRKPPTAPAPDHSAGVGGMVVDDAAVERAAKAVADDWQRERAEIVPWERLTDKQKELARCQVRIVTAALARPADADADGAR